jgi:hypothetical protein
MHTFWVIVTTQPGASFFWHFWDGLVLGGGGAIHLDGGGGTTIIGQCLLEGHCPELEELEQEELESDEQLSEEWEEEEHQSLTESATDSSFVTGTTTEPAAPRMLPTPGPHN